MSHVAFETPMTDSVAKIDHELAVGEDLNFQRRWWRFERIAWIFFVLIIVLDLAGAFGRGPLANAVAHSADRSIQADYERVQRAGTPSMMTVKVDAAADPQQIRLFISDSALSGLGLLRVIPAPQTTTVGDGGLLYTFPRAALPASIRFEFQPVGAGIYHVELGASHETVMRLTVAVVP